MTTQTRLDQVVPFIERVLKKRLVPMIHGSPAIGKSDIVRQIAERANLKVIDVRLSTYDPADMNGLPSTRNNGVRDISHYVPFDVFPLKGDPLPVDLDGDGNVIRTYKGWIVFMDELPSAAQSVQAAAFKFILDRQVGQEDLHERAFVVAAGNKEDDGAIVNPLPTPLQSRMINFSVYTNLECFMNYALAKGIDYRIAAFLNFKPDYVHKFDPDHDDLTFASPRTWMFLDKLIRGEPVSQDDKALVAGCVSSSVAAEFLSFVKQFDDIPSLESIVNNPKTARCPSVESNPSVLYAIGGMLAQHATKDNLPPIMTYIERMNIEFQVVSIRQLIGRNNALAGESCMDNWIRKYSSELWN